MFHFRLMICTVHGPDHEREEEDQPTAVAAGRPDFWNGVPPPSASDAAAAAAIAQSRAADAERTETRIKVYMKQQRSCPFPDTRHATPTEH